MCGEKTAAAERVVNVEEILKNKRVKKADILYIPRKVIKFMFNAAFVFILVAMSVLVFFLIQSRVMGVTPTAFGHQAYIVLSGSMSPEFDTGSLVLTQPLDSSALQVGDIITFQGFDTNSPLVTHRIVEIQTEGGLQFITRGDANNANDDNPVPASNVVGKVNYALPYMGFVLNFAQSREGLLSLIIIPGILIIFFEIVSLFRYAAEVDREEQAKKQAEQENVQLLLQEGSVEKTETMDFS